MINFASIFNQFRSGSNNAVNEILQQQDVTLTKLIDQESFINQYKAGNTKLMDFMQYDKIKQLIDYITIVGPEDDKKRGYKFPLTASDVLSSDNNEVTQYFLPEGKLYITKKYYEDQQVQEEVQVDEEAHQTADTTEKSEQKLTQPQKTIIKDTLQGNQQETFPTTMQKQQITEKNQNKQIQNAQNKEKLSEQPPKKTVKVKKIQKVEKTQKIEVQPLIKYLFRYFQGQINYTLTGYVCKVLTSLFNKKGNKVMEYLFTDNKIQSMLNHIQSRSVGEFLLKVMTFQSNKFAKQRTEFFKKLLEKLGQNSQVHVLSNFSSFVSQTIEKAAVNIKGNNAIPEFTTIFFTPQIVTLVIKNVMSDYENVSVYNAPILLTYLTNVPFTLPEDKKIVNQFKDLLRMFVQKSLQKLNITNNVRPKLGFGRIKIIEILTYILKENLLESRDIFGSQPKAFPVLFNLCKNYEMNNVLHNQVVKIISIAFSDDKDSSLCQSLIKNDELLNFITSEAEQDKQIRAGEGSQKYRKGYIGHIVQICRLIQEYASKGNQVAQQIQQREQFQNVLSALVEKEVYESNKSLAGFSMKKDVKHQVMFQKQDIISYYFDFLSHAPQPVFQAQPQPIHIQHPDFLQQMQRQIEENLSVQNAAQAQGNSNQFSHQHEPRIQVHFFKGHLDYDLDKLMQDL